MHDTVLCREMGRRGTIRAKNIPRTRSVVCSLIPPSSLRCADTTELNQNPSRSLVKRTEPHMGSPRWSVCKLFPAPAPVFESWCLVSASLLYEAFSHLTSYPRTYSSTRLLQKSITYSRHLRMLCPVTCAFRHVDFVVPALPLH